MDGRPHDPVPLPLEKTSLYPLNRKPSVPHSRCGPSGEEARLCLKIEDSVLLGKDTVALSNRTFDDSRQCCLETLGSDYPVKQYLNPKQLKPRLHRCENLETCNKLNYWQRITNVKNDISSPAVLGNSTELI